MPNLRYTKNWGQAFWKKFMKNAIVMNQEKEAWKLKDKLFLPIKYDNITFDLGLRLDVYVENKIICELKAQEGYLPLWKAQLISHLKLTGNRLGYLINFNTALIKDGITRIVV
jgi:GxxExxY protein